MLNQQTIVYSAVVVVYSAVVVVYSKLCSDLLVPVQTLAHDI